MATDAKLSLESAEAAILAWSATRGRGSPFLELELQDRADAIVELIADLLAYGEFIGCVDTPELLRAAREQFDQAGARLS